MSKEVKWLTRQDVATTLGVLVTTIDAWTKQGMLTGYQEGARVRYKHSDIKAVIQKEA